MGFKQILLAACCASLCLAGDYPVPAWPATYNMSLSTIIMPCNNRGFITDNTIRRFGVVDLDWTNTKDEWKNTVPMTCEENLVSQAVLMKNETPDSRVWVYRNTVLAMPWFASVRKIMEDPTYRPWFLKFKAAADGKPPAAHDNDGTYKNRVCDDSYSPPKCSDLFHSFPYSDGDDRGVYDCDAHHTCDCGDGLPCGMYLFDHRSTAVINNQTIAQWFVDKLIVSETGLLHPAVDGFFIDDTWSQNGAGDLDGSEIHDIGLSATDLGDLRTSWVTNMDTVKAAILANKGFIWQQMINNGTCAGPYNSKATCAAKLRAACRPNPIYQHGALFYGLGSPADPTPELQQHVASFLLMRGPYAWLGYSWKGCGIPYARPVELDTDYGVPLGLCTETSTGSGVFSRTWSRAVVTVDCNTWTGTIAGGIKPPPTPAPPPQPALPLSLRSVVRVYGPGKGGTDTAPCAARSRGDCTVFTQDGYTVLRREGTVWSTPNIAAADREPPFNNTLKRVDGFFGGATTDNSASDGAAPFTPTGFANASNYGETFYVWEQPGMARAPGASAPGTLLAVEVWYSAAQQDHWVLASADSRAAAKAGGYVLVGVLGYALPPQTQPQPQLNTG
jgi:hypothetical protein